MPQKPITRGETSRCVGVRLTKKTNDLYDQAAKDLHEEGYKIHETTKSALIRCVLEDYLQYAKVAFRKRHQKKS